MEFKPLELSDRALVDKYLSVWDFESAELVFSNMYIWKHNSQPQLCEQDGFLYYQYIVGGKPAFMPPIPIRKDMDFCPAMTRIEKYMKEQGWEVNIRMINEELREMIERCCPGRFAFTENRDYEDYIYRVEDLRFLSGKKLHGKRNHINKFLSLYGDRYTYEPLKDADIEECIALYDAWLVNKNGQVKDYEQERIALVTALNNMEALNLKGCAIRIDGKIEGFSVGAQLNSNTVDIHIEKGNDEIQGIYPFINQQFIEHEWAHLTYVNREEDMGIPGLRRAKMSYNPVRLVRKYEAKLSEL